MTMKLNPPPHVDPSLASLTDIIDDGRDALANVTGGRWGQGETSHHTASFYVGREPYAIATFRHANDAAFLDFAHLFMGRLLDEVETLAARIAELEAQK